MRFIEHCSICGQELTDASGSWKIHMMNRGIMQNRPSYSLKTCSYCQDRIERYIQELMDEDTAVIVKEG